HALPIYGLVESRLLLGFDRPHPVSFLDCDLHVPPWSRPDILFFMTGEGQAGVYLRRTGLARPKAIAAAFVLACFGGARAAAPPDVSTFGLGRLQLPAHSCPP